MTAVHDGVALARRRVSRRRARQLIRIGQRWEHRATGQVWRVRMPHRSEGAVELARGDGWLLVSFGELARQYALIEDGLADG